MGLFNLFSKKKDMNEIQEYLKKEAVIIDVRTLEEWNEGHIKNAKHIVLNTIPNHLEEIKLLNKPIIAVCKSGARSDQASKFLSQNGVDAINGGSWQNVNQLLDSE
jgi:phage shock protein E